MVAILFLSLIFLAAAAWVLHPLWSEALRLNLTLETNMAVLGSTVVARIAPTNAAGAPAPVFTIEWFEDGDSYSLVPAPDGLSVTFVADAAGTGNRVTVTATTKGGSVLSASLDLPDVDAPVDEEAVALNLTFA